MNIMRMDTIRKVSGLYLLIWLTLFMFSTSCFAELGKKVDNNIQNISQSSSESANPEQKSEEDPYGAPNDEEPYAPSLTLILSALILFFGLVVILLEVLIILRSGKGLDTFAFKIISLTLIITGALFLMTAGYSENQLTPIIGLLGTLAGYILGQNNNQ